MCVCIVHVELELDGKEHSTHACISLQCIPPISRVNFLKWITKPDQRHSSWKKDSISWEKSWLSVESRCTRGVRGSEKSIREENTDLTINILIKSLLFIRIKIHKYSKFIKHFKSSKIIWLISKSKNIILLPLTDKNR